jgi:hypothetical protein
MTTALEATRGELATLRLRVNCLERAEALLGPVYEATQPRRPTSPGPRKAKRAPRRPRRRSVTCAQVREQVIAHAPITRSELIEVLGSPPGIMDKKLRRLVASGEIGVDGEREGRAYRSPDTPEVVSLPSVELSGVSAPRTLPDRGVYPMYDAIVDLDGATTEQLAGRTGLPANLVVEQGRRLIRLGLVGYTGVGDARVWLPAQPEIARDAA